MIGMVLRFGGVLLVVVVMSQVIGLAFLWYGLRTYDDYWRGRANQNGDFLYVALGDSAAQSVGASRPEKGYVGLLAESIQQTTGRRVRVINLSRSGATLEEALRTQTPQLANYNADLVTAEIGANDMRNYDPETFRRQYERFVQALPPGRSVISDIPYFGGRGNMNRNAQYANVAIRQLAQKYGIPHAPLHNTLADRQSPWIYASDFFHPNDRGYQLWYEAFWPSVNQALSQPSTPQ